MAMVSTFLRNNDESDATDKGLKITIISVLPKGMDHHATTNTTATYQVDDRPVVHYTIHIPKNSSSITSDQSTSSVNANWTIYPTAVIHRLHQNFLLVNHSIVHDGTKEGGQIFIAISSNLPPASGLSSSSAFVTGLYMTLNSHLNLYQSIPYRCAIGKEDDDSTIYNLSTYLGNVENGRDYVKDSKLDIPNNVLKGTKQGGVGTFGGSEDHAAILMGRSGEMSLLSFCPTRPASVDMQRVVNDLRSLDILESNMDIKAMETATLDSTIEIPSDLTFVIAYSGARAEKAMLSDASIGFNTASQLARDALELVTNPMDSSQNLAEAIFRKRNYAKRQDVVDIINDDGELNPNYRQELESKPTPNVKEEMLALITHVPYHSIGGTPTQRGERSALLERFEQFYDESECLVPAAAYALSNERYDLLGPIVDASHRGAVNLLKNQIEETAWLPLWARGMENDLQLNPLSVSNVGKLSNQGPNKKLKTDKTDATEETDRIKAFASSAFGAGFGGSCWALVYRHQAKEFARQWQDEYNKRFPVDKNVSTGLIREFFITDPGPGAFCL